MNDIVRSQSHSRQGRRNKSVKQEKSQFFTQRGVAIPKNLPIRHRPRYEVDIERINHENKHFLKHLQSSRSAYDVYKWEKEHRDQQAWIKQFRFHKTDKYIPVTSKAKHYASVHRESPDNREMMN